MSQNLYSRYVIHSFLTAPYSKCLIIYYDPQEGLEKTPYHVAYVKSIDQEGCVVLYSKCCHRSLSSARQEIDTINDAIAQNSVRDFKKHASLKAIVNKEQLKSLNIIFLSQISHK